MVRRNLLIGLWSINDVNLDDITPTPDTMVEIVQTPTESPVEAEIEEVEADEESEAVDDAMELVEPELPPGPKPTRPDSVHDTEMWSKPISCLF